MPDVSPDMSVLVLAEFTVEPFHVTFELFFVAPELEAKISIAVLEDGTMINR